MARGKKKFDDDTESSSPAPAVGGVHPGTLKKFHLSIDNFKQKQRVLGGDISADWKAFEEAGGDKLALRIAKMLNKVESNARGTVMKNVIEYLEVLGISEEAQLQLSFEDLGEKVALVKGDQAPVKNTAQEVGRIWADQGKTAAQSGTA